MIYRFEHEASLPSAQYDRAVRTYASPSADSEALIDLTPSFEDGKTRRLRRAGTLILVSAFQDEFAGYWTIDDGPTEGKNAGYEDMLHQVGLPASVEYYSLSNNQHLAAGKRINDGKFAVTSLFCAEKSDPRGRPASEDTLAKRRKLEVAMYNLVGHRYPLVNQFGFRDVQNIAKQIPAKKK